MCVLSLVVCETIEKVDVIIVVRDGKKSDFVIRKSLFEYSKNQVFCMKPLGEDPMVIWQLQSCILVVACMETKSTVMTTSTIANKN